MSRRGILVAFALLCGGSAAIASPAAASDASATQAYIKANYAFVRAAHAKLPTSHKELLHVVSTLSANCPRAAFGSPQNVQSEHLSNEVIGLLVIEAERVDLPPARSFLAAVEKLHWSNGSLNSKLHTYFKQIAALSKLAAPDVCTDIRTWVAGGHAAIPAPTLAFDAAFLPNWVVAGYQPSGLARYESGATRSLARRTVPLELALEDFEASEVYRWAEALNVLELGP